MMSDEYFESALNSLKKPQDATRLIKILFAIRKEVDWPKKKDNINKLREKGCLKHMVLCLQQNNVKIIDITLSILGNCCLEQSCARDVIRKYNILPHINSILTNHKYDSIYGRIFRIISNICHHWERLANMVVERQPSLIDNIVNIIIMEATNNNESDLKITSVTLIMAVRALRELLNGSTAEKLVKSHNVIKAAAVLLNRYTPEWLQSKNNEDILNCVLRLLHCYSKHKYTEILTGLQTANNGNAMEHLGKLIIFSPYIVVRIIMNLMKVSTVRSDIPISDIANLLIENIRSDVNSDNDELKKREFLKCLCFLIQHPSNKEEMKNAGIIPIFLEFLRDSRAPSVIALKNCYLIVLTLRTCMFDESSTTIMVQNGIIDMLREKLEWLVGSSENVDLTHEFKKRKNVQFESRKRKRETIRPVNRNGFIFPERNVIPVVHFTENCETGGVRCTSPSSDSELSFSSGPSFTPPSSPAISTENESLCLEGSDSDEYSPVCSEIEDVDSSSIVESFDDLDTLFQEDDNFPIEEDQSDIESLAVLDSTRSFEKSTMSSMNIELTREIIAIIKMFAKRPPAIFDLASPRLLITLLKLVRPFNSIFFTIESLGVMLDILTRHEYLLHLMQTDFIPVIYDLTTKVHGEECSVCLQMYHVGHLLLKKLTHSAESGCGRGDIAHNLLRGSLPLKQKLALVIPYIIRNKHFLGKLMMNCGGLSILIKLLKDNRDLQYKSIKVLCAMALRKGIKNPAVNHASETLKLEIKDEQYQLKENCPKIVMFKFDDGTCLKADRDFLAQQSDYFNRLLSGTFKESQEDTVRLCNVASRSFKYLLLLMEQNFKWPQVPRLDMDLSTLLDVILLSDRYLLMNLCSTLMTCVERFQISTKTVPTIYRWSLESGTNLLRIETVAFSLVGNVLDSERYLMFQNLFDLGYSEQFIDDIQQLLQRYL